MPPQAGEHVLSTLYVDIHCVFSAPGQRPVHDRFEKSSYFYLHHNPSSGHGRIEIANNAGTQDQDAFEGLLDNVCITYSYKRPSTASITFLRNDDRQWQVRAYDPRQERQYMYPLQSADLYFWTSEDAQEFVDNLKTIARLGRLDVRDAPTPVHSGHQEPLSPVVQQLERAAISSPYERRAASTSTAQSVPPPPLPALQQAARGSPHGMAAHRESQSYQPVPAYNPAAPSAPEPRTHREKTPPPVDADAGTGLGASVLHDQATAGPIGGYSPFNRLTQHQHNNVPSQPQSPYSQSFSPPPHASAGSGPPSHYAPSFAPPPTSPPAGQQHFSSPAPPYASQPTSPAFAPPQAQSFPPPPQQAQVYNPHNPQHNPNASFSSPPPASGYAISNQPPPQQQQQQQQQQQAHNPYHYAQFSYEKNTPVPDGLDPSQIHSQVYRPTEEEASKHAKNEKAAEKNAEKDKSITGKIDKFDKGVNKFLKKWDKKLG